jgi:hypothetical protein
MFQFIDNLSLGQIAWVSIPVYIFHYMEEGPRLVRWMNVHFKGDKFQYTQKKLNTENLILFTIQVIILVCANMYPESIILHGLILSIAIGFFGNFFFHAIPNLKNGIYSPGVITAGMFNPIMFLLFFAKAGQQGVLNWISVIIALIAGITMLPIVIAFTHKVLFRKILR